MSRIRQVWLSFFSPRHAHHQSEIPKMRNLQNVKNFSSCGNQFQAKTFIYLAAALRNLSGLRIYIESLNRSLSKVPLGLKKHSDNIVRMCAQQCECVAAHKLRRGLQIINLYTRLWEEVAFKEFLRTFRQRLCRRGRMFMLGAAGLSSFDWDKERIHDDEMFGHLDEIDYIYGLVTNTMTCNHCGLRQVVNSPVRDVTYCKCKHSTPSWKKSIDEWLPFIEGDDMLIWKKESNQQPGMISYKVYGTYDDVTAEDFLQVQMDVANRKEWDPTAVQLSIVDQDPESNSDVVYWEMEWPRLFANRDYVFMRRYVVDEDKKMMLIVSQGTSHPCCPETADKFRVKDYWSFMVIKPYTEFNEPGIEFALTYFDNPGIAIPSAVTAWVAMSGLPNFLLRLRSAAREVGRKRAEEAEALAAMAPPAPQPAPLSSSVEPTNIQLTPNNNADTYFQQFRVLFI